METSSNSNKRALIEPGKHIPQLDGLRGLAILMVTLYRFGREIPSSSSGTFLAQAIELGTHGVELFFVLSGFLITGILLDSRGQADQLRNFFARRCLRILPLYFAALLLFLWLVPWLSAALGNTSIAEAFAPARQQQVYLWFYLTNIQMSLVDAWCFGPLDHFWSLAVEEHFYLLWPLVIVLCRSRLLIGLTLALTIACMLSRTAWLALGGSATPAEVLTIWRCDGLLIGALAAMLVRSPGAMWSQMTKVSRWIWLPALALAVAIDVTDRRMWLIGICLWNVVALCLLVNIVTSPASGGHSGWLSWFFRLQWLRGLGKLSYGMYVFQSPLIPIAAAIGWKAGVSLPLDFLYVVGMFALTVATAWCSWHGYEKHWLQLKKYFPQADAKPSARAVRESSETRWVRAPSAQ